MNANKVNPENLVAVRFIVFMYYVGSIVLKPLEYYRRNIDPYFRLVDICL